MIGNDVIDLELASVESDWKRKGFLEKIFTASEQKAIRESSTPELLVWEFWSRKESAYKIYNRQTGRRAFNPLYFECAGNETQGVVAFGNSRVFYRTIIENASIHTICVSLANDFENVLEVKPSDIFKVNGLPFLKNTDYPISKSHHGRFEKAVCLIRDGLDLDLARKRPMHRTLFGDFE